MNIIVSIVVIVLVALGFWFYIRALTIVVKNRLDKDNFKNILREIEVSYNE